MATSPLRLLEQSSLQERAIRDGLEALIEKERKLAEIELLIKISSEAGTGARSGLFGGGGGHAAAAVGERGGANSNNNTERRQRDAALLAAAGFQPMPAPLFDDSDALRVPSTSVAPAPVLPSGMLRPRAERPELSALELTLLKGGGGLGLGLALGPGASASGSGSAAKAGLDLSRMRLTDDSLPEVHMMFQALSGGASSSSSSASSSAGGGSEGGGGGSSLRILDVSCNGLGKAGASALADAVKRFPRLEALCAEDNELGGKAGVGAVLDIATRAASMAHVGITINDAHPLPFSLEIVITPPGIEVKKVAKSKSPGKGGAKGGSRSASPPKGGAKAKSKSPGKAAGGAKAKAGLGAVPPGTAAHLAACVHGHSAISSLSLAGSSMDRDGLVRLLQTWAPPPPKDPPEPHLPGQAAAAAGGAHHAPAAAAGKGKAGAAAAGAKKAAAPAARGKSPAKGSKAGGAGAHGASSKHYVPLLALNLARLHIGALGASDVALALCPVPAVGDPACQLGHVGGGVGGHPPPGAPGAAGAAGGAHGAKPPAAAASAAKGGAKGTSAVAAAGAHPHAAAPSFVGPPPGVHGTLHGSLLFCRVLDLSSCGLTSHGALPVLDAVARHTLCLSYLSLRDNFLDDAGAGALATALRINHDRLAGFAADAAEITSCHTPMALLTGREPMLEHDRLVSCKRTWAVLHGAGLTPTHTSPLRVVDVRNNPLSLSASPEAHPGCAALVECIADLRDFLTVCGPGPSVEGILQMRAASLLHKPDAEHGGHGLGDEVLAGWGGSHFYDLAAISAAAKQARTGSALADPRLLLPMPAGLALAAAKATEAKARAIADGLAAAKDEVVAAASAAASAAGGSGGGGGSLFVDSDAPPHSHPQETSVLWRLAEPRITACIHRGLVGSPLTASHSGAKLLSAALSGGPHDAALSALPAHLGAPLLSAGIPSGMAGHATDAPAVIGGVPSWSLRAPRVYLEWRAGCTAPAALAGAAHAIAVVFHVLVGCGPGGGRPYAHVYTSRYGDGSRDRAHARQRMAAKLASLEGGAGGSDGYADENGTGTGSVGAHKLTAAALSGVVGAALAPSGGGAGAAGGARLGFEWQDAAGLDTPRALGAHNKIDAGVALPPALAAHAIAATGADVAAWPVAWHCAALPSYLLCGSGDARLHVFAEVVQTGVRGVAAALAGLAPLAGQPAAYGVHVFEAEVVAVEPAVQDHGGVGGVGRQMRAAAARSAEGSVLEGTEVAFSF